MNHNINHMERYVRNMLIDGFGRDGQTKLSESRVLVVGAGGLGSPVLMYLAAAGVGTLGVIDYDVVDVTNLQRQVVHGEGDIGRPKVESARETVENLNSNVSVVSYREKFREDNAALLVREYDFVIDCCDNYEAKYLINDICVAESRAYSHGAILAMRGEVMTYVPGHADYRSVFPAPPAEGEYLKPDQAGVLGAVAGVIGSIQATEAIKYLTGIGELLTDRILIFDGRNMTFKILNVRPRVSHV